MDALFLVRYGELGLKGKNRGTFINTLIANIRQTLKGVPKAHVFQKGGRIFLRVENRYREDAWEQLQRVFGIVSFSQVEPASADLEAIQRKALFLLQTLGYTNASFKVETRRSDKNFPLLSPQVSAAVGSYLLEKLPETRVDVHHPQVILTVEIRQKEAYLFCGTVPGSGGLPVGVTGKGVLLLSGGIDSPVAGWMGMKRGLRLEPLHFFSFPFTGEHAKEKVVNLCRILARYQGNSMKLHIAPFTEIQTAIRQECTPSLTITLMRRMMLRVADAVADKTKALSLWTGESLGQVASQTAENILVINTVTRYPVLRPLIGLDKEEIVNIAKRIGTYPISILPYEDCCTLFVPKHPRTRPTLAETEREEERLDLPKLVNACVAGIETTTITP